MELVLALPLLLFVMALMINIGTAGAWKIRTQSNARHAAWRALTPRTGNTDPNPPEWPSDAQMGSTSLGNSVLPGDPYQGQTVVRGPALVADGQYLPVNRQYLDFEAGMVSGFAEIRRPYALLATMPGDVHFDRDHQILDGSRFQYWSMGLANNSRRVLPLYNFLLEERAPAETQRFTTAALAVHFNPNKQTTLTPLTGRDPEVMQLMGYSSPNFQPSLLQSGDWRNTSISQVRTRVPQFCESDPNQVRVARVEPFKKAVRNTGHRISDYYIGVYQSKIDELTAMMPRTPAAQAALEAQIQELQDKLDKVRAFKGSLPPYEF